MCMHVYTQKGESLHLLEASPNLPDPAVMTVAHWMEPLGKVTGRVGEGEAR